MPRVPCWMFIFIVAFALACSDDSREQPVGPDADATHQDAGEDASDVLEPDTAPEDTGDVGDDVEDARDVHDVSDAGGDADAAGDADVGDVDAGDVDAGDVDVGADGGDAHDAETDVCVPQTCQTLGATACGEVDDGCGGSVLCGRCPAGSPNATCPAEHWCWVYPKPSGNLFRDLWVIDSSEWWAVGLAGAVLRRKNGTYEHVDVPTDAELLGVWASASDDVWIVSVDGEVLHFDGQSWQVVYQETDPDHMRLAAVFGLPSGDIYVTAGGNALLHYDGQTWDKFTHGRDSLKQVWASSTSDVWLLGNAIIRYDGSTWSDFSVPGGPNYGYEDVWGFGGGELFLAGSSLWHYDGSWQEISTDGTFFHVWGSSPTDVYAGYSYQGSVHWDGQDVEPAAPGLPTMPNKLHGSAADDVWGALDKRFYYFDGAQWHQDIEESPYNIEEVWGPNDNEFWGLLDDENWPVDNIARWTNGTWGSVLLDDPMVAGGIWGSSSSEVWLAGGENSTSYSGVLQKWDGTQWTTLPRETNWGRLEDVHGTGPNNVWAVGAYGTVLHDDGTGFTKLPGPTIETLQAVWAFGSDDVWVGGPQVLYHWDGTDWTDAFPNSSTGYIYSIWGAASDDVWAVGRDDQSDPLIWHYDGQSWTRQTVQGDYGLSDIWGRGADDVWMVGGTHNTFYHWDGASLNAVESGTVQPFSAVWGTSTDGPWVFHRSGARMEYSP